DHPWAFRSQVLFGTLQQDLFRRSHTARDKYHHIAYSISSTPGQNFCHYEGLANLERISAEELSKGDKYSLPTAALHRIFPITENAVTLVEQEALINSHSNVFRVE